MPQGAPKDLPLDAAGVTIASGMFGTVGEDYPTPETIRRTGGVVPDGTWEQNWRNIQAVAGIAMQVPGTWGEEVVVGTGQVDWHAFFRTLDEVKFTGDLAIEREAGTTRVADIRRGREYVLGLA